MKQEKIKNVFKKVCIAVIGLFVLILIFVSVGDNDTEASGSNNVNDAQVAISEEVGPKTEDKDVPHAVVGKDFSEISTLKPRTVRNDTTGNWRIVTIAENIEMQEYAVDYYNRYFEGNGSNEVHGIVNFTNNTTTKISDLGSFLEVVVFDYVKGEEHDAKKLFSGNLLGQYFVDKDTAEIEVVQ